MIQFEIKFDSVINRGLYKDYCNFIFDSIKEEIRHRVNPLKYKVREKSVLSSSVMKWTTKSPPSSINLIQYVENCLEMVEVNSVFVIRFNDKIKVYGSKTKVSTLMRLLEYGNEKVRPYPLVTSVLRDYSRIYKNLLISFIRERMIN